MATYDSAAWIGPRTVRPTEAQLTAIDNYDRGLGDIGSSNLWRHTGYFALQLNRFTDVSNETAYSVVYTAKVPFKVVSMQVGCEACAATTGTGDVERDPAAVGAYATMSTGAVDIKTGAGTLQELAVLDGAEDVAEGDLLRMALISGSAAALSGGQAILHCFRL